MDVYKEAGMKRYCVKTSVKSGIERHTPAVSCAQSSARMIRIVARIRVYQRQSGIHETVKLAESEKQLLLCLGNSHKINVPAVGLKLFT